MPTENTGTLVTFTDVSKVDPTQGVKGTWSLEPILTLEDFEFVTFVDPPEESLPGNP